ncbi:MAG: hypothetical protein Q4C34_04885 [Bacteroidales bacterium]|nr:hypothetical protein [Bacteroidales bacterium]
MTEYPDSYKTLRRNIYVMRNGIVADSLRRGGCPYRLIYGVNLPQLTEIARETGVSAELAALLRRDKDLREASLMAAMLYPVEELTYDEALEWAREARWSEDADILCFKLLRHTAFADRLAADLCADADRLRRYTGLRLWFNIVSQHPARALAAAETELARPDALSQLASMLAEEARFLMNPD